MKIEVAKEGRMDMSGQGLIRAIQNNNMPLLDLLVRESIQNSLDAYKKGTEFVQVDFGIHNFRNSVLSNELEGIESTLTDKYRYVDEQKYLYIRDTGTEGLTGPLHFSMEKKSGKNNLLKLVYEIAKPQEGKGSGGSWGYGKTIYFRVGIGLVIYYSRIKNEYGEYESRLAACLVEDENRDDALLRNPQLNSHRGLAWWGRRYQYESNGVSEIGTVPETDSSKINRFLSIFGFQPFADDETGTAIIIPYIDEKSLLSNNINSSSENSVPWVSSVDEYLKIAVQRWYVGRLNNPFYSKIQKQPWLRATVNEVGISKNEMAKTFVEIQKLYNYALSENEMSNDYYCRPIKLHGILQKSTVGSVAYKMYTPEEMDMTPPENNPSPFIFAKNEDMSDDYKDGDVILTYFRKPGMAVSYDTSGEWVKRIKCNNEKSGQILIAVFALNSSNKFDHEDMTQYDTVEEYFRGSERADHAMWYDTNVNYVNPRILTKIQYGITKKINETYKNEEEKPAEENSSLSKMFGDYLLPPKGFGKRAGKSNRTKAGKGTVLKHKNVKITVQNSKLSISDYIMIMPIVLEAEQPVEGIAFSLDIAADGKNIPLSQWKEKVGLDLPFYISGLRNITVLSEKKVMCKNIDMDSKRSRCHDKSCSISFMRNSTAEIYGIKISSEYKELEINAEIEITVKDRTAQLGYQLKDGE